MRFVKMHGAGNDFIMIEPKEIEGTDYDKLAVKLCDRHFGIGGDGIILILPSDVADFRMRIFNSDGSEPEMCGNGIRCFAKYVYDHGMTQKDEITVETLAGIKRIWIQTAGNKAESVTVDMGEPILEAASIPVNHDKPRLLNEELFLGGAKRRVSCVSMGNPHAVIFVDEIDGFPVEEIGPKIETDPIFPKRTNVEFVKVLNDEEAVMRVWERGAGVTLACGTGACATAVATHMAGLTGRKVKVHLLGGTLTIDWREDNHIYMTGPAQEVFKGEVL